MLKTLQIKENMWINKNKKGGRECAIEKRRNDRIVLLLIILYIKLRLNQLFGPYI